MWAYIQTIIISILCILILHHLFYYLRDTLTTKKTKDLVGIQTQKYKSIVDELIAIKTKTHDVKPQTDAFSEAESVIDFDTMESRLMDFAESI